MSTLPPPQSAISFTHLRSTAVLPAVSPLGAAIALVAALFIGAVLLFLTRDFSRLELMRPSFSSSSQADYTFTLEQRVAPQRAAVTRFGD